jgi:hypothetical protein
MTLMSILQNITTAGAVVIAISAVIERFTQD